ncbi:MAG: hypothetical protein E7364_04500 [Clostridiales bacterium]|nr:hypothetical protein [Clostridiales bacterium]
MFSYSYDNLKRIVETERGKAFVTDVEKAYKENYADKPIFALDYSQFKRFYIDGDRSGFQSQYFDRRKRLMLLQVLALSDEKYLVDLENILSAICEEFIWVLPAHAFEDEVVAKYDQIDLFSAETAFYLSETVYVFGDKLSKDIRNRISVSVKLKVVDVFENGRFNFEETHSNWAAVCGCGVGLAYLYLFPERFPDIKERIFICMEHYLLGISEDGYCEEGMNYWQYGFGFFALFFDVYTQLTGERPEILSRDKVLNLLKYPTNANMGGGVYLPFSDGGASKFSCCPDYVYVFKNLFGEAFDLISMAFDLNHVRALMFRTLNGLDKFGDYQEKTANGGTVYYREREVFIRKEKNYAFTVKCGTNYEMHNHNDVGAFQIVKDGKRLIADLGAGEYTKEYFRDREVRFGEQIFVCGSMSHSVPIINGQYQKPWKPYRGQVLSQSEREIEMDIAGAYEENAQGMLVKYITEEDKVRVCYRNLQNQPVRYRFVSDYMPKITDEGVVIEDMKILSKNGLTVTISEKEYKNVSKKLVKAYLVDYEVGVTNEDIEFVFSFKK